MFCTSCLEEVYKENILDIVSKSSSWSCPYKRGACVCKSCTGLAEQKGIDISEQGPSKSQYTMLNKALTQSKIKQMLDFNADLIVKFQNNLQYLNDDELLFYLSVIQSNIESIYPVVINLFLIILLNLTFCRLILLSTTSCTPRTETRVRSFRVLERIFTCMFNIADLETTFLWIL